MKRIFFLLICIAFVNYSFAQRISYSPKQKIDSKTPRFSIIGKNSDGIVLRRYGKSTNILDVFDDDLSLKYSVPLIPARSNSYTKGVLLNQFGGIVFFLVPVKELTIMYAKIYSKGFETDAAIEIPLDTIYDNKESNIQSYRYVLSRDKSKILIYYPYYKGNQLVSFQVKVYSRDLTLLSKHHLKLKQEVDRETTQLHSLIKNNGDALFYILENSSDENTAYGISEIHQFVIKGMSSYYSLLKCEMILFGKPEFKYDEENNRVGMGGLISDEDKKNKRSSTGYFVNIINSDSSVLERLITKKYSSGLMYDLTGKDSTRQEKQLSTFELRKLVFRNDGGVILVMESLFSENDQISYSSGAQPSYSTFRTYNVFYSNDVICFSISPEGKEDWNAILRKKQVSENDNGIHSSFALYIEGGVMSFIYLDEIYYNSNVNQYVLNHDGQVRRKIIFSQSEEDIMLIPQLSRQVSKAELVIPSLRKNMLSIVKIDF